jgi:hypothetical protein
MVMKIAEKGSFYDVIVADTHKSRIVSIPLSEYQQTIGQARLDINPSSQK